LALGIGPLLVFTRGIEPPTINITPNSPIVCAKVIIMAVIKMV